VPATPWNRPAARSVDRPVDLDRPLSRQPLAPRASTIKKTIGVATTIAALLPDRVQPQPRRYGLVALVDGEGTVLRTVHGPAARYTMITGVRQQGNVLWLGSLTEGGVGLVDLAA